MFTANTLGSFSWRTKMLLQSFNVFKKILDKSRHKSSKILVNEGSKFYNRSIKSWLRENFNEMCSIHNKVRSAVAERFIRTLKSKIYKHVTPVSKNVCIDKLHKIIYTTPHIMEQPQRILLLFSRVFTLTMMMMSTIRKILNSELVIV